MLPISVCIIGKNEEKYLEDCLKHLIVYNWEIIFVDTGSTDETKEIAMKYTENVYDFEWINDFSAARNFAASKASNDWILAIDCDEYIEHFDATQLLNLLDNHLGSIGQISLLNIQIGHTDFLKQTINRLYNRKYYHWENPIHEQIVHLDSSLGFTFSTGISVVHYGYALNVEDTNAKTMRNLNMLLSAIENGISDPYYYYKTGCEYANLKDYTNALKYFEYTFEYDLNPSYFWVQELMYQYGATLLLINQPQNALVLEAVYEDFSSIPEYIYIMALIYAANGMFAKSLSMLNKVVTMKEECHILTGVTTYLGYFQLGNVCHHLKKDALAKIYLEKAGSYEPALALLNKIQ